MTTTREWTEENLHKFTSREEAINACTEELNFNKKSVLNVFSKYKLWENKKFLLTFLLIFFTI